MHRDPNFTVNLMEVNEIKSKHDNGTYSEADTVAAGKEACVTVGDVVTVVTQLVVVG